MEKEADSLFSQEKIKKILQELQYHNTIKQYLPKKSLQEETSQIFNEQTIQTLEKTLEHIKKIRDTKPTEDKFTIPITLFSDRKLTILEHVITYLKESQNLTYQKIALILNRNPRTIWTVYQRARKKRG